MRHSASLLALTVAAIALVRAFIVSIAPPDELRITCPETLTAEERLALGLKIEFSEAGLFELELIPRIADNIGGRIVDARDEILAEAASLPEESRTEALTVVRGIGEKTARRLREYLEFTFRPEPSAADPQKLHEAPAPRPRHICEGR